MSRTVTQDSRQRFYAQQTDAAVLHLLKISHADLDESLYLVDNPVNVTHLGQVYTALGFRIALPKDSSDTMPVVTLEIDNVDRTIVEAVRTISSEPDVELAVILSTSTDVLEVGWLPFKLRNVKYDRFVVSGDLWYEDIMNDGFPKDSFSPNLFPGLF